MGYLFCDNNRAVLLFRYTINKNGDNRCGLTTHQLNTKKCYRLML